MSVIVTTYNVLSSAFSDKKTYPKCTATSLDPTMRLILLKRRLQEFIDGKHVICLQEVSQTWHAELFTFFSTREYAFICSSYGNRWSDYMGAAIAYPTEHYILTETKILWIGNTIQDVKRCEDGKKRTLPHGEKIPSNIVIYAQMRPNTAIFLALSTKDAAGNVHDFVVANYHSPAAFWHDTVKPVITLHNVRYIIEAQKFAAGKRLICAGDFNNPPVSAGYKIITGVEEGVRGDISYPEDRHWLYDDATPITWRNGIIPMHEVNSDLKTLVTSQTIRKNPQSEEPDKEVFTAMWIDYIFYSDGFSR